MHKAELQRQATMLIKQLSTEELSEAIDYLATIRIRKQSETPGAIRLSNCRGWRDNRFRNCVAGGIEYNQSDKRESTLG